MRARDVLGLAAGAVSGHRTRSALALLGTAIGIAAVVLLTALGEGARLYVTGQFRSLGTNLLVVVPGFTETTGGMPGMGGVPHDLTLQDAEALRRGIPRLRYVSPIVAGEELVSYRERSRRAMVLGATRELYDVRDLRMHTGRFLPEGPWERGSPVVVLGATMARELFGARSPIGEPVRIGDHRMRVIGVIQSKGTHLGVDLDETVFVPVANAMRMFDRSSLFRIVMQTRSHADLDPAAERVREILIERHGEEDVTVLTQDAVVASLSSLLGVLTLAVAGIAAISLAVAGIGIMNVMLVTVSERTREIGLCKALGARRRQVLALFLAESALLAGTGGLLGLLAGWLATRAVAALYPEFPAQPPLWAVLGALALALSVGAVFGLLPAARASRMDPVAALARR